jgi:hypothetical protein
MFSLATAGSNSSMSATDKLFVADAWCTVAPLPLDPDTTLFPGLLTVSTCFPEA